MSATAATMDEKKQCQRQGVLLKNPYCRLSDSQVKTVDSVSRRMLEEIGLLCFNQQAVELFKEAGCPVSEEADGWHVKLTSAVIDKALETAPSTIVLGARKPENRLVLDAAEPRVRFISGSETNVWLEVGFDGSQPSFERRDGSIERLCKAAHLADNLENLDGFIRCVNIQDKTVTEQNKDVNKFLASLNNITKHVQAGLTTLDALDDVIKLGHIIAGGEEAFREEPVLSFITCVIKSPLQVVDDTADKLIAIARSGAPVVISSCPMGGATGAFGEFGMVAQINAELLAGVTLNQLASPGAPVLYGAVPVRTRLDNLNDMYGAPEFNHYNLDCAQMARHYGLPCYSTAGVGDTDEPGIQATVEKMLTLCDVPRGGAQYIHYAFGLLERTNVFCPEQAIMDNAHIGIVKHMLAAPEVDDSGAEEVLGTMREVMESDHKTFIYHIPLPSEEPVYAHYPLESGEGGALRAAHERFREIMATERDQLDAETQGRIRAEVPNVLDEVLQG
jgi:trimethylamine--corrinoid protein Co-methyltransferase